MLLLIIRVKTVGLEPKVMVGLGGWGELSSRQLEFGV